MQRKRNESEFGSLMRQYGYFIHKWRDRGYVSCPHCHRTIVRCPSCRQDMLLPKAQTYPDFLVAYQWAFVEAKGARDRFAFSDITPNQFNTMRQAPEGWLFLEIGDGRAPGGREAYLVPWGWVLTIIDQLEAQGVKSIVYRQGARGSSPEAREVFATYQLDWSDGGWAIPDVHVFWTLHKEPHGPKPDPTSAQS